MIIQRIVYMCVYHLKFTEPESTAIRVSKWAFSVWIFLGKNHTYKKTTKKKKQSKLKQTKKPHTHVEEMGSFQLKNLKEKKNSIQYFEKTEISE